MIKNYVQAEIFLNFDENFLNQLKEKYPLFWEVEKKKWIEAEAATVLFFNAMFSEIK